VVLFADGGSMSDFIGRLAGRGLGKSEAIQPRLPSIFEPQRTARGPLWGQKRTSLGRVSPDEREPGFDDSNLEDIAGEVRPATEGTRQRKTNEASGDVRFEQKKPGPLLSQTVPPGNLEVRSMHANPVEDLDGMEVRHSAAVSHANEGGPDPTARHIQISRIADAGSGSVSETSDSKESVQRSHELHGEMLSGKRSAVGILNYSPSSSVRFQAKDHPTDARAGESPFKSIDFANVTGNTEAPAEPAVRVSIGRVEVRAVFPPSPVRRGPTNKSKPNLSLEDYLKGKNRGRR
jgi:hypothetical protein